MVTIEVDEDVWRYLTLRKNPGDSFNDVLRRQLGLDADEPDREQVGEPDHQPADPPASLDDAIDAWEPPGEVDTEHARAALRDAVAWLDQHGDRAKRTEIVDGARGDSPLGERSWWERAVQPGLRELDGVEYRPGYHDYMVVG